MAKEKKSCNEAAILLIGRRNYSAFELRQKLTQKQYDEAEINATFKRLKELNYLDDAKYARHFVGDKARLAGWGQLRIELALRQKKIAAQDIENAVAFYERRIEENEAPTWVRRATEVLERRYGRFEGPLERKDFQKRMNFLLRRGYSLDEAKQALENTRDA